MKKMQFGLAAIAVMAATLSLGPAPAHAQSADGGPAVAGARRQQDAGQRILAKWADHVREVYGLDAEQWGSSLAQTLSQASPEALQRALNAPTFAQMNDELLRGEAGRRAVVEAQLATADAAVSIGQKLGDTAADLVFVPIAPCRIIDTRVAGGAIPANTVRAFDVSATGSFAIQGGEASDCNGVGSAGSFAAAMINFTVVSPAGPGYITAYPYNTLQPLAATVVYNTGDVVGGTTTVKLDQTPTPYEVSVYTLAQTDLVGDIVGYFIAPEPTALECTEVVSAGLSIAAGASGTQTTPVCPASYTMTGGSCSSSSFNGRVVTSRMLTATQFCSFDNEGAVALTATAYARCCRVPGR